MYIHQKPNTKDIPEEMLISGFAYLETAEKLNHEMVLGVWTGSYHRGQVIMWLVFHATELFLKACLAKAQPNRKITGHTLPKLKAELEKVVGTISLDIPFGGEGPDDRPEIIELMKDYDETVHQRLRYPTDRSGQPWSGENGFSAGLFSPTLQNLRYQVQALKLQVFKA